MKQTNSHFRSIFLTVFVLFSASVCATIAAYPEVFITFRTGFILWSDYNLEYSLGFILTNFFYQGGLQLWDYFGQMPMAYTYATYGLFKFQNVITALIYFILAPFSEHSAQLYHHVFAWGNLFSSLFLRVIGIFLLLNCVAKHRWVVMLATILAAVFFSQPSFLWGTFCFAFVPLFLYFILRFFQKTDLRYLAMTVLLLGVSLGNGIIHTAGFLYFVIHFFMLSCAVWVFIFNRPFFGNLRRQLRYSISPPLLKYLLLIFVVFATIVGPYAYIIKFQLHDVAFGEVNSRISAMFSPEFYFKKMEVSFADPRHFFKDTLNFDRLSNPTVFFGWIIFFLAAAGLVLSRNTIKWIFGIAILLLWLLNHTRDTLNIGLIAHWINALTNPFHTLLRSYFVGSYALLAYLLMPLAVLGAEEIIGLCSGNDRSRTRWKILAVVMFFFALTSVPLLSRSSGIYVIVCTLIVTFGIVWILFRDSRYARVFLASAVCFLTLADIFMITQYSKTLFSTDCARKPVVLDSSPKSLEVGYEFANPKIFPFRDFFTTSFSFNDEIYLWFPRGVSSDFRHMTNQTLNFLFINGHCPRHAIFENWINDGEMRLYVERNKQTIFMAQQAVKASPGVLGRISSVGLAKDVITVEDPLGKLDLPDQWDQDIKISPEEEVDYNRVVSTFSEIPHSQTQGDLIVLDFPLPEDFPEYRATTWFLDDQRFLRFRVERGENDWMEFDQTQGELVRPYTFDVQNIKEGMLKAAIPKKDLVSDRKFAFDYPSNRKTGVMNFWQRQYDNLGFDYRAPKTGWLVFQYPYDKKWRITVNGQNTDFYKVNKSFIGFPLSQGDHKILIQYWPDTTLRFWLLVSAILTTLGLLILIFLALRWEQKGFCSSA